VLIGVPVALAGAQLLASQLYAVRPDDPLAVSVAIATLAVAGCPPATCRRGGPRSAIR
jgi:hypothetical protein